MEKLLYKKESYIIRGGCFEVYRQFRNSHKEKVYERALAIHLKKKGLFPDTQKRIPIYFDKQKVGMYVPDIVVNDAIVIEMKCKPKITRNDIKQFWCYLKTTNYKLGFLINFGGPDGVQIFRRVYDLARKS